jgi:fido (protein-threonine AMPylation protein)
MWKDRALPDLGRNIKCGNSLIGPHYFTGQLLPDEDEMRRVNAFDWKAEFPDIFPSPPGRGQGEGPGEGGPSRSSGPGFDAVIGNPPYVRIQTMKEWAPLEVEAYKELFHSASKGNYDIYVVFVEKGLSLLNKSGRLGFILPHKFFQAQYGEPLRGLLAKGRHLAEVVHFGDQQVFDGATTYTCLLFLERSCADYCHFVKVDDLASWLSEGKATEGNISAASVTQAEWNFAVGSGAALFQRLSKQPAKLEKLASIFVGLQTSADKVYILAEREKPKGKLVKVIDRNGSTWLLERHVLRPFLNDTTVSAFDRPVSRHWLIFPYSFPNRRTTLVPATEMSKSYPRAWNYLKRNEKLLRSRESGKADNDQWYGYLYRKNLTLFDSPKLIVQVISICGRYAYDDSGIYFTGGGNGPYYGVRWSSSDNPHSLHYLQGLLNSKLLDFYLHRISSPFRGGYWSYGKRFIEQLPIRQINFPDSNDKAKHDKMVALVERMLDLHQRLASANSPDDKTRLQRQIAATDREIDSLVYDLYGLTEDEIRIVEGMAVASEATECENSAHEGSPTSAAGPQGTRRQAAPLAQAVRRSGQTSHPIPEEDSGMGGAVHGVRERTGEYGSPENSPQGEGEESRKVGSTRYEETAEGILSYTQIAERIALPLAAILDELVRTPADQISITSEWLCQQHKALAGHLFPDWAGRFRDRDVRVGAHTPPRYFEVPVHVRQFCDDLTERLRHADEGALADLAESFAWADWRFQWIHPFRDFNGRIGRVLLVALIHRLGLPPMDTVPTEPEQRQQYLDALQTADNGDLGHLRDIWARRIAKTL